MYVPFFFFCPEGPQRFARSASTGADHCILEDFQPDNARAFFPFFFCRHEFLEGWQGVGGVLLCLLC